MDRAWLLVRITQMLNSPRCRMGLIRTGVSPLSLSPTPLTMIKTAFTSLISFPIRIPTSLSFWTRFLDPFPHMQSTWRGMFYAVLSRGIKFLFWRLQRGLRTTCQPLLRANWWRTTTCSSNTGGRRLRRLISSRIRLPPLRWTSQQRREGERTDNQKSSRSPSSDLSKNSNSRCISISRATNSILGLTGDTVRRDASSYRVEFILVRLMLRLSWRGSSSSSLAPQKKLSSWGRPSYSRLFLCWIQMEWPSVTTDVHS